MAAVGIRCQTHTAWAFTMVQFNSTHWFQINKNQQKVKSAAFKIHQTTKPACCREAESRFRRKTGLSLTPTAQTFRFKCTCRVNLQQLKKLEMESHTAAIHPETSGKKYIYNDIWCNSLKHTGMLGSLADDNRNTKNVSYFSPKWENQAIIRIFQIFPPY